MTRNEYIFENAAQITEKQIRSARKLQSSEVKNVCKRMLKAILEIGNRRSRARLDVQSRDA